MGSRDRLGDEMKTYEKVTRTVLPPRHHFLVRLDGRAFHTYTRGLERPFDARFVDDMNHVALALVQKIPGAVLAFVQSDEITVLFHDFATLRTQQWLGGQVQKIVSACASIATAVMMTRRPAAEFGDLATFDARVFAVPDHLIAAKALIWRQRDAEKNSVTMVALAEFPEDRLTGLSSAQRQELLFQEAGINWSHTDPGLKRGRVIVRQPQDKVASYWSKTEKREITLVHTATPWGIMPAPHFTLNDGDWLLQNIPKRPTSAVTR